MFDQTKNFSLRDSYTIKNEFGEDCFIVYGRIFSLGDKLHLTDMQGRELFYIEQRIFRLLPEYTIYRNGVPVAQVKKNFTLFRPSFTITSVFGEYSIEGNFWAYDFTVFKNGAPVAIVSKKWFTFSDTYGVSVDDSEDAAFILALVIVLDQVYHDGENNT
ncbi:LURP-one-related/scramblase family protein [Thermoclostridium stercorarium]|uniref:LURP-one-related/scramblase family protein n=1 Tax=Thermoclostridium stercorarium TaxID=1510 RepID=UPI0034E3D3FA